MIHMLNGKGWMWENGIWNNVGREMVEYLCALSTRYQCAKKGGVIYFAITMIIKM